MRRFLWLALVAACGDNHVCDYSETDDTANETTPEMTNLSVGDGAKDLCGNIDGGHASGGILDTDRYRVTVGGSGRLLVEIAGDDGATMLDNIDVRVFDTQPHPTLVAAGRYVPALADFGAFLAKVAPGPYDVWVSAAVNGDLDGQIGYRIRITADHADACEIDRTDYMEAHDGDADMGNDTVSVDYSKTDSFAMMDGSPEPTGLTIGAVDKLGIAGSSGTAPRMDQYLDRDTYAFSTDENTNELTVRLDWTGSADLDYLVFEAGNLQPVGVGQLSSPMSGEVATFPARASAAYWLWVGRFETTNGDAIPYHATVCGGHFFH